MDIYEALKVVKRATSIDETAILEHAVPRTPMITGIYFLILKGEIVYIGQSCDVLNRITAHVRTKEFDSYAIRKCQSEHLNTLEAYFIFRFKPRYNGNIPSNPLIKSLSTLRAEFHTDGRTLRRFIKRRKIQPVDGYYNAMDFLEWGLEDTI